MRVFALVPLLILVGCTPTLRDNQFSCGPDQACPAGFTCTAGLCARGRVDASLDAHVADAPGPDAFQVFDVGFDALAGCNPLGSSACGASRFCQLNADGSLDCVSTRGSNAVGGACRVTGDCAPGAVCHASICRALCTLGVGPCPASEDCMPYAATPYGICAPR